MSIGYIDLILFFLTFTLLSIPLGLYIANVFNEKINYFAWLEKPIYKIIGANSKRDMSWQEYALAIMLFSILGVILLFFIQILQGFLPFNPQGLGKLSWDLALNTAVSYVSNTNWQAYAGETTMSYFTQTIGLAVQNFVSAATGIAVLIAFIRSFVLTEAKTIGNFWKDLVKSALYILIPLSLIISITLVALGVPQNFNQYVKSQVVDPQTIHETVNNKVETKIVNFQSIPMGPVASQEAIAMLGTNGGGFFNVNASHPYANPNSLSNLVLMLAIIIIPGALCFTFGFMVNDQKQAWTIYITMSIIFIAFTVMLMLIEFKGNPLFNKFNIDQMMSSLQSGGNMEGKEARFGIFGSSLFTSITTSVSCGAVNNMHDSLMPLGGFIPLFLIQLSEVAFGGVGSGLYTILIFVILSVFIAGLMIGRTPEYLGKKIESFEMKMVALAILIVPLIILLGSAISLVIPAGLAGIGNPSAHGLSEVLYAFSSAANNNGSAFSGLNANSAYYNVALAIAMFIGRFGVIIPILAIAGSIISKKKIPVTSGTMPTSGFLFVCILLGVIIIVGALTYIPALALGPIAEHFMLFK